MPVRLIPVANGKPIKLDKPVVLIGRNPDCDVILTRSRKVSRAHCIVACVENTIVVRDLGSTNGLWINGHRVERESNLRLGDELSIADVRYQLLNVERTESRRTAGEVRVEKTPPKDRSDEQPPALQVVSVSDRIDKEHEKRLRKSELKPINISQNFPVPIPEEDDSFVVEASMPRLPKPSALAELDQATNEPRTRGSRKQKLEESSCDVVPLPNQSPPTDESIPIVIPDELQLDDGNSDSAEAMPLASSGMAGRPVLDTGIPLDESVEDPIIPLDAPES
jgi:pSer/pThr/pTyr-binding forkhead associated (FHA) protein